ncbi:hypothetical protein O1L60_12595 [Streptomyces diastatochromogenes]|nr:hypothetical protein [Streptomyces diastatochromogenes]
MFLDSDDVLPAGAAEALVAAAERHRVPVAVGVAVRRELPEGRDVRWQPALYREPAVLETPTSCARSSTTRSASTRSTTAPSSPSTASASPTAASSTRTSSSPPGCTPPPPASP